MVSLFVTNFSVEAYLPYPTVVYHRLNEYCEFDDRGCKRVKIFVELLREKVKEEQGKDYFDNKIAYRIRHNESGTILYAGYKDGTWSIGLDAKNIDGYNNTIEFNK